MTEVRTPPTIPTPIEEITKSKERRVKLADILCTLEDAKAHTITARGNLSAAATLVTKCRTVFFDSVTREILNSMIVELIEAGWIEREMLHAKRAKSYRLLHPTTVEMRLLRDAAPQRKTRGAHFDKPSGVTFAGTAPAPATNGEGGGAMVYHEIPDLDDAALDKIADRVFAKIEAAELGGRPGRVAARLEQSLPPMVEEGAKRAVSEWFDALIRSAGFVPATEAGMDAVAVHEIQARLRESTEKLARADEELGNAREDLRRERIMHDHSREQLNAVLAKSDDGRWASPKDLRPNDLPEAWRALAAEAIAEGWTLKRTRVGHIAWRNPDGKPVFGPSTSSDWRAVENHRSDMVKYGFPRKNEVASVDND